MFIYIHMAGDPINQFNPAILLCLSQARIWISNVICCDLYFKFNEFSWEVIVCFVDTGKIVDHHCLNFLFMKVKLTTILAQRLLCFYFIKFQST